MSAQIGVFGATGYTGREVIRLLRHHPNARTAFTTDCFKPLSWEPPSAVRTPLAKLRMVSSVPSVQAKINWVRG